MSDNRRGDGPSCAHRYVVVRENSRMVICRTCRRRVRPFDVLLRLTFDWEAATYFGQLRQEAKERLERLKAEERRVRARLRRLADKLPEAEAEELEDRIAIARREPKRSGDR